MARYSNYVKYEGFNVLCKVLCHRWWPWYLLWMWCWWMQVVSLMASITSTLKHLKAVV